MLENSLDFQLILLRVLFSKKQRLAPKYLLPGPVIFRVNGEITEVTDSVFQTENKEMYGKDTEITKTNQKKQEWHPSAQMLVQFPVLSVVAARSVLGTGLDNIKKTSTRKPDCSSVVTATTLLITQGKILSTITFNLKSINLGRKLQRIVQVAQQQGKQR